ncbi:MAG TPA: phage/plasmid replication protein [Candidatus Kapabacteria bacterium]|nr:phage/plasmid replication protein [Candidatus Kapabacteria bacterium]
MYDTMSLVLRGDYGEFSHVPARLDNPIEHTNMVTSEINSHSGKIGDLSVNVTAHGLYIRKFSLAKFILGNNLQTPTLAETKNALGELEERLGVSLEHAVITHLDVGINVILPRPPLEYFILLGHARRLQARLAGKYPELRFVSEGDYQFVENDEPGTLYYYTGMGIDSSRRLIRIYDKIAEMKAHNEPIPDTFVDKNVFRFELCFLKKIHEQLKQRIYVGKLIEGNFRNEILQRLLNEYQSISRDNNMKTISILDVPIKNQTELARIAERNYYATLGGAAGVERLLNENKQTFGDLTLKTSEEKRRVIERVRRICSDDQNESTRELAEELDEAVNKEVSRLQADNNGGGSSILPSAA